MSYLYVKWNSLSCGLLASGLAIKACRAYPRPSGNGGVSEAATEIYLPLKTRSI
jgi:hypothetical protein